MANNILRLDGGTDTQRKLEIILTTFARKVCDAVYWKIVKIPRILWLLLKIIFVSKKSEFQWLKNCIFVDFSDSSYCKNFQVEYRNILDGAILKLG